MIYMTLKLFISQKEPRLLLISYRIFPVYMINIKQHYRYGNLWRNNCKFYLNYDFSLLTSQMAIVISMKVLISHKGSHINWKHQKEDVPLIWSILNNVYRYGPLSECFSKIWPSLQTVMSYLRNCSIFRKGPI